MGSIFPWSVRRATEHNANANNKRLCGLFCRPPAEVPEGWNVYSAIIIRTLLLSSSGSHHERCQYVHQTAAERISIKISRPDDSRIDLLFSFNRGDTKTSFFLSLNISSCGRVNRRGKTDLLCVPLHAAVSCHLLTIPRTRFLFFVQSHPRQQRATCTRAVSVPDGQIPAHISELF